MKHRIQKTKFGGGKDANDMLLRKMAYNFFSNGSLKTTQTKAKVVKQHIEKLVEKLKIKNEANQNVLKRLLDSEELVKSLYEQIPSALGDIKGGYVRIEKLQVRISDGAPMARLLWSRPVVIQKEVKEVKEVPAKKEAKTAKPKKVEVKEKK